MAPTARFSRGTALLLAASVLLCLVLAAEMGRRHEPGRLAKQGAAGQPEPLDETRRQIEAIVHRVNSKRHIARELIAGRLTLLQAAGQFRALNQAPPRLHWKEFCAAYPGDSDEERHCREVIAVVTLELENSDSCLCLAVRARLVAELESHRERGTLRLPAGPGR